MTKFTSVVTSPLEGRAYNQNIMKYMSIKEEESTKPESSGGKNTIETTYNHVKTILITSALLSNGLYAGISSPTLLDIAEKMEIGVDEMTQAMMFKAFGVTAGALVGGLSTDFLRAHVMALTSVCLLCAGVASVIIPFSPNQAVMSTAYFIQGLAASVINAGCTSEVVMMWKEKSSLVVHLVHAAYSFGLLISPLLALPFLVERNAIYINSMHSERQSFDCINRTNEVKMLSDRKQAGMTKMSNSSMKPPVAYQGSVEYAYVIVACISVTFAAAACVVSILLSNIRKTQENNPSTNRKINIACPAPCKFLNVVRCVLLFLDYMAVQAARALVMLIYTMAVTAEVRFTKQSAAMLVLSLHICVFIGRLVGGFVSHYAKLNVYVIIIMILTTAAYTGLTIWGLTSKAMLWFWSCMALLFSGPIYPALMPWFNQYIPVTGLIVGVFDLGLAAGNFIARYVGGELYTLHGSQAVLYLSLAGSIVMLVITITGQILGSYGKEDTEKNA